MTKVKGTAAVEADPKQQQQGLRKNNVWTREKITRLIRLYRQHECLWNNYIEAYKNKEKRSQAIDDICTTLRVTKFDFGKKIHNLRNQFNAELKKLERRIEESGGGGNAADGVMLDAAHFRSRWDHYESLLFLKAVIAPRPGYQSTLNCSYQQPRNLELKFQQQTSDDDDGSHVIIARVDDMNSPEHTTAVDSAVGIEPVEEDETEFQFEEVTAEEEAELAEQAASVEEYMTTQTADPIDQKYNPTAMREVIVTTLPGAAQVQNACKQHTTFFTAVHQSSRKNMSAAQKVLRKPGSSPVLPLTMQAHHDAVAEVANAQSKHFAAALEKNSPQQPMHKPCKRRLSQFSPTVVARDQWDAFGEMVAAEFRNLNSDLSRKKLKRKIMRAMLEVGEADDGININIAIN